MMPGNVSDMKAMKTYIRQLEDLQEKKFQLKLAIENASAEFEALKELEESATRHNSRLKQQLQQLKDFNAEENKFTDSVTAIRLCLRTNTMSKMLAFTGGHLENFKQEQNKKKVALKNNLAENIDLQLKSRPIAVKYRNKETHLKQIEGQKSQIEQDFVQYKVAVQDEKEIANIVFNQNITEMVKLILRNYTVADELKQKMKEEARPKLLAKSPMAKRKLQMPSLSVPEPGRTGRTESNDKTMSQTPATSMCEESLNTKEVADCQVLNRGSASRSETGVNQLEGNKRRPNEELPQIMSPMKMPRSSNVQS